MQLTVSIIGAGPTGFALATDLERSGARVLLYSHPHHMLHANAVARRGFLCVHGDVECCMKLRVTCDMREVVGFSKILVLTVPSTAQETILQELAGLSLQEHTIIAMPGNLFSLMLDAEVQPANVFETNLAPYSCRMNDAGELFVLGRKSCLSIAGRGTADAGPSAELRAVIQNILPVELKWCRNVMEVSLTNINGVFHPPMMLLNAGRIESTGGDFRLYRDGLTRSVANIILAVDSVRLQVGEALGFQLKSVIEVSNECYGQHFTDLVDLGRHSPPHNHLRAPPDMTNRNLSEDVPDLLVFWHSLAEELGIDASPIKAVIMMAQMSTGMDFMRSGKNFQKLRLDHMSRSDLIQRFGNKATENYFQLASI